VTDDTRLLGQLGLRPIGAGCTEDLVDEHSSRSRPEQPVSGRQWLRSTLPSAVQGRNRF
jgi:hypothetical protein